MQKSLPGSTVQLNAVHYGIVPCSAVLHSLVLHDSTLEWSVEHKRHKHVMIQPITVQYSTVQTQWYLTIAIGVVQLVLSYTAAVPISGQRSKYL